MSAASHPIEVRVGSTLPNSTITNALCATIPAGASPLQSVACPAGTYGRYVSVQRLTSGSLASLALYEVQVFGPDSPPLEQPMRVPGLPTGYVTNIAANRTAAHAPVYAVGGVPVVSVAAGMGSDGRCTSAFMPAGSSDPYW